MSEATMWRRSSFCSDSACVEIKIDGDVVSLRNSMRPEFTIELAKVEWEALKRGVLAGEF